MSDPSAVSPAVFHILLALSSAELHGLGIAQAVDEASEGSFGLGPGTLYRSLKEMVADGLIVETVPPEGADPRRRFYGITDRGRAVVHEEATRLARIVEVARRSQVLPELS